MNTWKQMDSVERFVFYFRASVHIMIVGIMALVLLDSALVTGIEIDFTHPAVILACVVLIGLTVLGLIVTELEPVWNNRPRANVRPWRIATAIASTVAVFAGILLEEFSAGTWAFAGVTFIGGGAVILALVVIPWMKYRWWLIIALFLVVGAFSWWTMAIFSLLIFVAIVLSIWSVNVVKEAERARYLESALKVSEERLRFAQELHDTLGQHLAAMSVKAELARALAARNDDRLASELAELQTLTKTSMAEMREVVDGYRSINLATEIEGARLLLSNAGIQTTIHGGAFDIAEPDRELAAWFIREAATNILRHAHANYATFTLGPAFVEVINDGVSGDIGRAGGMSALQRRAGASGSSISLRRDGAQFFARLNF
ncbi:sensor histidine kinase [Corynebacterium sp. S7]